MNPKMRCHLPGTFLARDLGAGAWRLSRTEPGPIEVFVSGAAPQSEEPLRAARVSDIDVEWRANAAWLSMIAAGRPVCLQMQTVVVHEPLPQLYAALPLATLDAQARRFWRRVFRLVRIPGGRLLLGVFARRSRGRH